jgi:hypothetical protein
LRALKSSRTVPVLRTTTRASIGPRPATAGAATEVISTRSRAAPGTATLRRNEIARSAAAPLAPSRGSCFTVIEATWSPGSASAGTRTRKSTGWTRSGAPRKLRGVTVSQLDAENREPLGGA